MSTKARSKPGTITVHAVWDDSADVWVATTDDMLGLATEAASLEALREKLVVMIPELLEANSIAISGPELTIQIVAEQTTRIPNPMAA
jgi:hypothetical protein